MSGLLNFLGGAANYVAQDQMQRDAARREISATEAKLKLSNKLQIDLEERKRELAAKYPTYSHFVTQPDGSVIGVGVYGNVGKVYDSPPETKAMLQAQEEAKIKDRLSSSAARDASADASRASAELNRARLANPEKYRASSREPIDRTQMTGTAAANSYSRWLSQNGMFDENTQKMKPLPDNEENFNKWKAQINRTSKLPGGGILSSGSSTPDPFSVLNGMANPAAQEDDDFLTNDGL